MPRCPHRRGRSHSAPSRAPTTAALRAHCWSTTSHGRALPPSLPPPHVPSRAARALRFTLAPMLTRPSFVARAGVRPSTTSPPGWTMRGRQAPASSLASPPPKALAVACHLRPHPCPPLPALPPCPHRLPTPPTALQLEHDHHAHRQQVGPRAPPRRVLRGGAAVCAGARLGLLGNISQDSSQRRGCAPPSPHHRHAICGSGLTPSPTPVLSAGLHQHCQKDLREDPTGRLRCVQRVVRHQGRHGCSVA